jgi:hypothetical protein
MGTRTKKKAYYFLPQVVPELFTGIFLGGLIFLGIITFLRDILHLPNYLEAAILIWLGLHIFIYSLWARVFFFIKPE